MTGTEILKLQEVYNKLNEYLHSDNPNEECINETLKGIQYLLRSRGIFVS
ncbi:hypothetical protein ACO1D0_24935 [Bacillus licheniformis]